jgi:hypothetical protein
MAPQDSSVAPSPFTVHLALASRRPHKLWAKTSLTAEQAFLELDKYIHQQITDV